MSEPKKPVVFISKHRARFEEIDPNGHLNVNRYLSYFTDNRFIGERELLGKTIKDLAKMPFGIFTRKLEIEFLSPIFADDEFTIESYIEEFKDTSCRTTARLIDRRGQTAATAIFHLVCVETKTQRPMPWPVEFMDRYFEV